MTQYLILHKVSGEPAFDIAHRMMIGDEEGWIVTTSGHRAYPYKKWALEDLYCKNEDCLYEYDIPDDWPDHYNIHKKSIEPKIDRGALFGAIMNVVVGKFPRRF